MNARTRHGLTHEEREALGWAILNCPKPTAAKTAPPPDEFTTEQAALRLRSRGYDVDFPALSYLIRQGVATPSRDDGGRNYRWDRSNIDEAAQHLEKERKFTASYEAADTEGTDPFQEELAFHHAKFRTKLTDRDQMVKVTFQAPVLSGQRKRVVYLSPEEWESGMKNLAKSRVVDAALDATDPAAFLERYRQHVKAQRKAQAR